MAAVCQAKIPPYLSVFRLQVFLWSRVGFGPEKPKDGHRGKKVTEQPTLGILVLLLFESPGTVPIGKQEAQEEEHQHGDEHLLVGVTHQVTAFLVDIDEGGDA